MIINIPESLQFQFQDTKRQRVSRSLDVVSRLPSDRTVTSYLTVLLFLSLDKAELYSEKEPFIQVRIKVETVWSISMSRTFPRSCYGVSCYELVLYGIKDTGAATLSTNERQASLGLDQ